MNTNNEEFCNRNKQHNAWIWSFLLASLITPLQALSESATHPEVRIYGTQIHRITSAVIGEAYQVFVHLPPSYEEGERRYPVLYLTDADLLFGIAANVARLSQLRGDLPDFIIAGIAYGVYETDDRNHRARDFLAEVPEDSDWQPGADKFLQFLRTELVPYINANFRTDPTDLAIWARRLEGTLAYMRYSTRILFSIDSSSPALRPLGLTGGLSDMRQRMPTPIQI